MDFEKPSKELAVVLLQSGEEIHVEYVTREGMSLPLLPHGKVVRVTVEVLDDEGTEHPYISLVGVKAYV